ncbi:aminotransferase class V-fold PLP-dependent enzyme [Lacunimicrobium album]
MNSARHLFANEMAVDPSWVYLDHAAVAPLPPATAAAIIDWVRSVEQFGCANWPAWRAKLEDLRGTAARLINASTDEMALIRSTTEGINFVAEGFPFREGDNVVVPANEFPSNLFPWMNLKRRGVEVRIVPVDDGQVNLERLNEACDSKTRIVAASWVSFNSGHRIDPSQLAEIAHRHGALAFLDAIQGLGMFPLDVKASGIDFLAADGHKWLLGPEGAGVFYIKAEHLNLLDPVSIGWNSVESSYNFDTPELNVKKTAQRYEGGTYAMPGFQGLKASLDLFEKFGIKAISESLHEVTNELVSHMESLGGRTTANRSDDHWSGIVPFEFAGHDPMEIRNKLFEKKVLCSVRGGKVRFSPHAYTTPEMLQRLTDHLATILHS